MIGRWRRRTFLRWLLAGLLLSAPLPTSAGPETASKPADGQTDGKDVSAEAKSAFDQGAKHYIEGEYAEALVDFERAQQHYPSSTMLFYNIALTRAFTGDIVEAALSARQALDFEAGEKVLSARPDARARSLVAAGETYQTGRSMTAAISEEERRSDAVPSVVEAPESTGETGRLGWVGWTGVGLGVVGIAGFVGIPVLAGKYDRERTRLEKLQTVRDDRAFERQRSRVRSTRRAGRAMYVAAPILTAAGLGLVALDLLVVSEDSPLSATWSAGGGRVGVTVGWRP